MKLSVIPYILKFKRPFVLAHGTRSGTQLAYVLIEQDGHVAWGEASLPPYYTETFESVKDWVEEQQDKVSALLDKGIFPREEELPFSRNHTAASAALQSAILHWFVKSQGSQLAHHFHQREEHPGLTLTMTKQDIGSLEEKLIVAANFSHLKLKLTGEDDDLEFVRAALRKSELPFCVDLNQGCKSREAAVRLIEALESLSCVLVEQPLHAHDHEGHAWLKERTKLPVIADESILLFEDLVHYHEAYSGVNVKLMKCGGPYQAQRMLQWDGAGKEFKKLLGCMSESSLGVATAAVLASQCSLADLDAPYLVKNDPFKGFGIAKGRIELTPVQLKENHLLA